ncbi:MAG TPA: 2-C-methyl-D-erythritol 2,4-cyclodiphosphate synthase [Chitinophagaceae bacterium]|nr:2-C-methyl-D-erythritol 2,4-cyclodiphosphate synthase [Chitinophagaceae bacterium]
MDYRIGFGVDFHALKKGREFFLGGIRIPHHQGSEGHSDADVLLHAICDALLGAASLGDIGEHFPDTDPAFLGIDSKILLSRTLNLIRNAGWRPVNIDSTVCLQLPLLKPHIPSMRAAISSCTGLQETEISIKATTTEKLGFIGREEGVAAYATVLLCRD